MLTGIVLPMPRKLERTRSLSRYRGGLKAVGRIIWTTVSACVRFRVLGLAAETAFFGLLSLPPLIFGLAGSIGFVAQTFSVQSVTEFRNEVIELAGRVLTSSTIDSVLAPTLDDVLSAGRFDILSIGFVIALWSGSRAMAVFVDTITIMYGRAGERGIVHSRVLSFVMYLIMLLTSALLLPLVLAGPTLVSRVLPSRLDVLVGLYWPTVLIGTIALLTAVYHRAVPIRHRWRADLPGAILTLLIWLAGSWVLRLILGVSVGSSSLYGPLAAPLALMMWLWLMALAALIGAAFNAAVESVFPGFAGITVTEADDIADEATA